MSIELQQLFPVGRVSERSEPLSANLQEQADVIRCGEPHCPHQLHTTLGGHFFRGQERGRGRSRSWNHTLFWWLAVREEPIEDKSKDQILDSCINGIGKVVFQFDNNRHSVRVRALSLVLLGGSIWG